MRYAIENTKTGERVRYFNTLPASLTTPNGKRVLSPVAVGDEGLGFRLIQIDEVDFIPPAGDFRQAGPDTETRNGNVITIIRHWEPTPQADLDAALQAKRDALAAFTANKEDPVRAALLVLVDEFNRHSAVNRAILDAADTATSLGTFKSAMAKINGIQPRDPADLLNAIRSKLGAY
jgi:hypothetical protein